MLLHNALSFIHLLKPEVVEKFFVPLPTLTEKEKVL